MVVGTTLGGVSGILVSNFMSGLGFVSMEICHCVVLSGSLFLRGQQRLFINEHFQTMQGSLPRYSDQKSSGMDVISFVGSCFHSQKMLYLVSAAKLRWLGQPTLPANPPCVSGKDYEQSQLSFSGSSGVYVFRFDRPQLGNRQKEGLF